MTPPMITPMPELPSDYSFAYDKRKILPRFQGKPFLIGSTEKGPEPWTDDPVHAAQMCWQDFYEKATNKENEGKPLSLTIYGYRVDEDTFHPGCLTHNVGTIETLDAIFLDVTDQSLRNLLCGHCDDGLIPFEEIDELFGPSYDNPDEGERADMVELYSANHTSNRTEGFRCGLPDYAALRNMTPKQYANWIEISPSSQQEWLRGYQDALDDRLDEDGQIEEK